MIYWHITRLAEVLCVRVHALSDMVSLPRAHASLHLLSHWPMKSLASFFPPFFFILGAVGDLTDNAPLLYRCSLGTAITLCPSLPRPSPSLAPLFGQFNHGAMTQAPAPFLFHHVVTLSRERRHFTGFLSPVSLPFVLVNPSTLPACMVLCSGPLSLFPVSVSPGHLLCVGKKRRKKTSNHTVA